MGEARTIPHASAPPSIHTARSCRISIRPLRFLRCFLLASLLCAPGFAQTPTATLAETSGAKASFEQGLEAYRDGRYRAAIEHFQEADRLAPSPRLSLNVARAYE